MQIILCLAAAMICGLLLTRVVKPVHLPNVTGYLIAGLIIGPYCLGIFQESDAAVTDVLTDVALGFIAFSIGGEFRISHIKQVGTSSILSSVPRYAARRRRAPCLRLPRPALTHTWRNRCRYRSGRNADGRQAVSRKR